MISNDFQSDLRKILCMFWKVVSKGYGKENQCFVTFVVVFRATFGMVFCGVFEMIFEMVSK